MESKKINCGDIIKKYLIENGYDGLYSEYGDCACLIEDLVPCVETCVECFPGYRRNYKAGEDCGSHCLGEDHWHIEK